MQIVSKVFSVSIEVFSVNALDVTFNCYIFNNRYDRKLKLLKSADDHFDTLYNSAEYKMFGFCQNIVFNVQPLLLSFRCSAGVWGAIGSGGMSTKAGISILSLR